MGSAAWEVLDILKAEGVPPHRVMLSHVDRNPDPGLHEELAAAGAYIGYDGMARANYWPDSALPDCLLQVAARGGAERIVLGSNMHGGPRFAPMVACRDWRTCRSASLRGCGKAQARDSCSSFLFSIRRAFWHLRQMQLE
jgi:hypothetical protein